MSTSAASFLQNDININDPAVLRKRISDLESENKRLKENETLYVINFDEIKLKSEQNFKEKLEENKFFNKKESYLSIALGWLSKVIDSITYSSLFDDFWHKIVSEFTTRR